MNTVKPASRRARKKSEMETAIIDTAMSLFETHGLDATTMEGIADACDIAKATLYRYFPVKEAILAGYWQQRSREAHKKFPDFIKSNPDTRTALKEFMKQGMQGVMKNHELYKAYFSFRMKHINDAEMNRRFSSEVQDVIVKILAWGVERGELRSDIPLPVLALQYEIAVSMLIVSWLRNPEKFRLEKSMETVLELFLHGGSSDSHL